jgi:hypothetical protein
MMKRLITIACLAALTSFAALQAGADVIFSQGPLDGGGSTISELGGGYRQQSLDDFVLDPGGATVTDVHWWGSYGEDPDPTTDDFTIRFFTDVGGSPNSAFFHEVNVGPVTRGATGMTSSAWGVHDGGVVYEYSVDLPASICLDGGTTFYMSILNNTDSEWGWLEDGSGLHWFRGSEGGSWSESSRQTDLAFQLTGTPIPEPTTMLMLGGLGAGLASARKMRRKK